MKVLTIGMDRKLFDNDSEVLARTIEYSKRMEELHIVVYTLRSKSFFPVHKDNLHIYPTNSTSRYMYMYDAYKFGKKIMEENKFVRGDSVISTQDPYESGIPGFFLSRKFNFSWLVQVHSDFFSPYFAESSFYNTVGALVARFLIPRANGLRVVSQNILDSIHKKIPSLLKKKQEYIPFSTLVLPIFVDIKKIKNTVLDPEKDLKKKFPQFNFFFLMASRLTKEKEISTAIIALREVLKHFPRAALVIAGAGPELFALNNLAKGLGISDNVLFLGWQDQESLVSLFKSANVFLLTSRYEGYGLTLIESAACGVPIITTPVGVARDIFKDGENSFVCDVGNATCFADRMYGLIQDNSKRQLFKIAIQETLNSVYESSNILITREQYVDKYISILEKLTYKLPPKKKNNRDINKSLGIEIQTEVDVGL
jgi:glycosyltransferase involved in cell wall biosynthesis